MKIFRRPPIPALLGGEGPFRWFWTGQTISLFGDQITAVAVPLVAVLYLHAGAAQMGYLVAAAWLPYLLFSLPAGAWVDRRRRRRLVMIAADLARAALLLTVPAAAAKGILTLGQLYAVIFLSGTCSAFFGVAYATLFQSIVPRVRYLEGQALMNGSRAFAFVGGPSVAGVLVQVLSGPSPLVADAFSFLLSAFSLTRISPSEPVPSEGGRGHLLSGARFLLGNPVMRATLAATATINLFNFAYGALAILYFVRYLQLSPALVGTVLGIGAIGGLVGSALAAPFGRRIGVGPAFIAGCSIFTAPLVLVPLAAGPRAIVVGMVVTAVALAAFGVLILDINGGAIQAALIPGTLRARVSGAYTVVNYGVRPVGSLLGGLLATAIGVRQTLFLVTIAAVFGVLFLIWSPVARMSALPEPADQGGEADHRSQT